MQVAGGAYDLFGAVEKLEIEDCLVMGMPVILVIIVAFRLLPVIQSFPSLIRPVAGNSFVVGVIEVLLLQHVLFKRLNRNPS